MYFSWLKECRVYINQTKFKTDTLVACGFLVGAHPGHLRRDEAEEEFRASLEIDSESLPFQLSSRSISVPMKEGDKSRYGFQAIVIETSTQYVPILREKFYALDHPNTAREVFPYTGMYQFVPLLQSKEWTIQKIYQLAKLHVSIIDRLKPIYIANLQDINNVIDAQGTSLMHGFYGMTVSSPELKVSDGITPATQLIHSIHNTGKINTKVVLIQTEKFEAAMDQLTNLHNIIKTNIDPTYLGHVLVPGSTPMLTSRRADSVSSCNYSSYASALLNTFNPQEGEGTASVPQKRVKIASITYAKVDASSSTALQSQASLSTLTEIDKLYDAMSAKFGDQFGTKVSINELEKQVEKTSSEISHIRKEFETQLSTIQTSVDNLTTKVNDQYSELNAAVQTLVETIAKQNYIIAGIQQDFKLNMETLSKQIITNQASNPLSSTTSSLRRPLDQS
jgi:archaellum component FlaC